ncbi:MAG: helix-turn-helix domain-containing protein [Defluviitaleaceae bacterium]|nr:helix-turn-helix domain-containing protein [Defluviitaleaceae bacterium]
MSGDKLFTKRLQAFGKNMRAARKDRGLSAVNVGKCLGLSTAYVALIERSERTPSVKTMLDICDFFGTSVDEMMVDRGRELAADKGKKGSKGDVEKKVGFNDDFYDDYYDGPIMCMPPE